MGDGRTAAARRLDRAAVSWHAGRLVVCCHQYPRRHGVPGRRAGTAAGRAQQRRGGDEFLTHADPAVHLDGRTPVPYRAGAQGDRRRGAADQAGAGPARRHRRCRRYGLLRHLWLNHRHDGHAWLADAAGDAGARIPSRVCHRADHGDWRRRHADPAIGADGAARQLVGYFHFQTVDRRRGAGAAPEPGVHRLYRRHRATPAGPGAAGAA